eukprot:g8206.t1
MAEDDDIAPPDIKLDDQPLGIDFHPQHDVVAVGLITGAVELHTYAQGGNSRAMRLTHHADSCRAVGFSGDGNLLYSASADKSLSVVDRAGQLLWRAEGAHEEGINAMLVLDAGAAAPQQSAAAAAAAAAPAMLVATGDDGGVVKVWDVRQQRAAMQFREHEDFVADFALHPDGAHLLACGGDATLTVMDLRQRRLLARSEDQEDELMSVLLMKHGRKVVCGTQEGLLHIFSWGQFADMSDRFPGHPSSVDTLALIDENTLCSGSSDGIIRILNILPNKLLGVVGDHDELPVERLLFSRDRSLLGTISHDDAVHFWDVRFLLEDDLGAGIVDVPGAAVDDDSDMDSDEVEDEDDEDPGAGGGGKAKAKGATKRKGHHVTAEEFYEDMD